MSRPSVKAWITRSGTSSSAASRISASQVGLGRVHAAARHEPDQVHPLGALERRAQRLAVAERAVADRLVDPGEILRDDRARRRG